MHVEKLTLVNVRQFEERTFHFKPGFNLLVGENGAGKTTVLRGLIAALAAPHQMGRRLVLDDDDVRLNTRRAELNAEVHSTNGSIMKFHLTKTPLRPAKRSPRISHRPLILYYASNEAICAAMKEKRKSRRVYSTKDYPNTDGEEFLYRMWKEEKKSSFILKQEQWEYGFGSSPKVRGFVAKVLRTFSENITEFYWRHEPHDCELLFPKDEKYASGNALNLREKARLLTMRFLFELNPILRERRINWPQKSSMVLSVQSHKNKLYNEKLPDIKDIYDYWQKMGFTKNQVDVLKNYLLEIKLAPRILVKSKAGPLGIAQLSDGEQRIFSLIVDIARQLSKDNNEEGLGCGEAIILIDEIDVHLHAKWQRLIVPALENLFPSCQFITTSHSPFVVQAVAEDRVQHLNHNILGNFHDRGIEQVAFKVFGIEDHSVGARYLQMLKAARMYFKKLEGADISDPKSLETLKAELDELSHPYADNPAYQAFLEMNRIAKFKE